VCVCVWCVHLSVCGVSVRAWSVRECVCVRVFVRASYVC